VIDMDMMAMALTSGYNRIHPIQEAALRELGVTSGQITQTVGNAPASAGFHAAEGQIDGNDYTSCIDLSWSLASPEFKARMVMAGFAPFFRHTGSFADNRHIHAVSIGLRDSQRRCRILAGPRQQIIDATRNLNGLVGHSPIESAYAFTKDEMKLMYENYADWVPDVATKVLTPEGNQIVCYAFLEQDSVRCNLRPFAKYWGVKVEWDEQAHRAVCSLDGRTLDLSSADMRLEGGEFTRLNVRGIAEAIGLKIDRFEWSTGHSSATVHLAY